VEEGTEFARFTAFGGRGNFMTEAVSIPSPTLERTGGAIALARVLWWIALISIVLGAFRITATYSVLGITFDEPAHIAAGMQLLDKDEFTYEPLHPPLARVAEALGPFIAGYHSQNGGDMWIEGRRIFYGPGNRPDNELLALARLGVLPFFVASLIMVWFWTSRHVGRIEAALAVILLANLPVFLAHSGLATTDAPFAATFTAAFFSFLLWLERPSPLRGSLLGVAVALAICTKLSALLFLPAAGIAVIAYRWACDGRDWRPTELFWPWHRAVVPLAAAFAAIWVIYGCHADPLYGIRSLADGVRELTAFARSGDPSFFLGNINDHGSWAFFPILLLVKSPIPFLIALAIGAIVLVRRGRRDWQRMAPLLGAAAIVASAMPSTINIGLRHILPAFPLLAVVAGIGLARLLQAPAAPQRMAVAGLLVFWQVGEAAAAAPDYLAYFNQFALGQPQRIVAGSDLDWGQDVRRLLISLRERRVQRVHLALHTSADLRKHDFPPFETMYPGEPTTGWIAISEQMRAFYCAGYKWLDPYTPVARIGSSILLYHVPGPEAEPGPPDLLRKFNWTIPQPCSRQAS
jgi:4-amino-4-deoxy-L-arabinose transferase-like glycosyltransferase